MNRGIQSIVVGVGIVVQKIEIKHRFEFDVVDEIFRATLADQFADGVLGIVFAMQRLYASLSKVGTENRVITASAGASVLSALVLGCGINLWAHTELCVAFWLSLGLANAAYRLRMEERREADEQYD